MTVLDVLKQPSLVAVTRKHHGLGNRVRVVLGARSLARSQDRRFFYAWPTGSFFGASMTELWEVDDAVVSTASARLLALRFPFRDETLGWLHTDERRARIVQIRTAHALHLPAAAVPWEAELQALRPVAEIRKRIGLFFEENLSSGPYVGVMIRSHTNSHAETLRKSPVEWYLGRMHEIRQVNAGVRFFVSADTLDAERRVTSEIPNSFGLGDKGAYNSLSALTSAVVDLYLLASSGHLLGPHYSSFPELAQKLAGPRLRLETSQTDADSRLRPSDILTAVEDPTVPSVIAS